MTFQQAIQAILLVDTEHGVPVIKRREWGPESCGFKFDEFGALRCAYDIDNDLAPLADDELEDEYAGDTTDALLYCLTPEDLSSDDWLVC